MLFLDSLDLNLTLMASIASNDSSTSFIEGRCLGSFSKHLRDSCAACIAAFGEYCPSILPSIKPFNFFLLESKGFTHSTKFCCPDGLFVSSALMAVIISNNTTPKPYTSLFTYKCPVELSSHSHMLVFVASYFIISFLSVIKGMFGLAKLGPYFISVLHTSSFPF
ncbi:putative serine/threonine-protein kinase PIX13 [Trifolium repens]|nr:putative serine/threonine-protein kinase PIX13 [Trifolium repens]